MMRFIFFVVIAVLVIGYVRHRWLRPTVSLSHSEEETMLQCNYCQVYFPKADGVLVSGASYCSLTHAQLGNNQG